MQQNEEEAPPMSYKRVVITLSVITTAVILVIGLIALTDDPAEKLLNTPAGKLEILSADALKAKIDLYHTTEGRYPYNLDDLRPSSRDESGKSDYRQNLKELDYSRRGDGEAYRFTYSNIAGETVKVEGNYKLDYR